MNNDIEKQLQQQIQSASASKTPLQITGGNSKFFYGLPVKGEHLEMREHQGVINYQPSELVITARAGTPLSEIENILADKNQQLPFEPPHFSEHATLGGCIATGLSGPARPYAGSARDFVLGLKVINGKGEILQFGGEVMKNVAGYDLSRLVTGSLGTLGAILEVSLKVLPQARYTETISFDCLENEAIQLMNQWAAKPFPVTASCFFQNKLFIRLSGYQDTVKNSANIMGGDAGATENIWQEIKEQRHSVFNNNKNLWRLSLPGACDDVELSDISLIEWNGAQRWHFSEEPAEKIFSLAKRAGGYATLFKTSEPAGQIFQPLDDKLMHYHRQIKKAMDPENILNPGRMYKEL